MHDRAAARLARGAASARRRVAIAPYLFLVPALAILLGCYLYPVVSSFRLSFYSYRWNAPNLPAGFVGLANYVDLLQDADLQQALRWTLLFTVSAVTLEFGLGMGLALALHAPHLGRLRGLLRGIILVPMMVAPIVAGLIWRSMLNPEYGPVNHLITSLGLPPVRWFTEPAAARVAIILTDLWLATPFVVLVLLAGLQGISEDLYEAARIDGAGAWQSFRAITLPMLRYPIVIALSVRTMDALRLFDQVAALTKGGPGTSTETVMYVTYQTAFKYYEMGRASALSFIALIGIALVTTIYLLTLRSQEQI